jgi:hypothetical protein
VGFNTSQRKRRDAVLNATLADFETWQLGVACSKCRRQRVIPFSELRDQYWGEVRIVSLVNRLRCSTEGCASAPSRVVVISHRGDEIVLVGTGAYG